MSRYEGNNKAHLRPKDYDKYGDVIDYDGNGCNNCIHNGKRSVTGKCDMCEGYSQWELDHNIRR